MVALVQYDGFYETHPVFLPLVVVGVQNGKEKVWLNKWVSVHFMSTNCIHSGLSFQKYVEKKPSNKDHVPLRNKAEVRLLFDIIVITSATEGKARQVYFSLLNKLGFLSSWFPSCNITCVSQSLRAQRSSINAVCWILLLL